MRLINQIHNVYASYKANFDLDDCDCILRVECPTGPVEPALLIDLLKSSGFRAEILPDDVLPFEPMASSGSLFAC